MTAWRAMQSILRVLLNYIFVRFKTTAAPSIIYPLSNSVGMLNVHIPLHLEMVTEQAFQKCGDIHLTCRFPIITRRSPHQNRGSRYRGEISRLTFLCATCPRRWSGRYCLLRLWMWISGGRRLRSVQMRRDDRRARETEQRAASALNGAD